MCFYLYLLYFQVLQPTIQWDHYLIKMRMYFFFATRSPIPFLYTISRISGYESYSPIGKICQSSSVDVMQIYERIQKHFRILVKQGEHQSLLNKLSPSVAKSLLLIILKPVQSFQMGIHQTLLLLVVFLKRSNYVPSLRSRIIVKNQRTTKTCQSPIRKPKNLLHTPRIMTCHQQRL